MATRGHCCRLSKQFAFWLNHFSHHAVNNWNSLPSSINTVELDQPTNLGSF